MFMNFHVSVTVIVLLLAKSKAPKPLNQELSSYLLNNHMRTTWSMGQRELSEDSEIYSC